MKQLDKTRKEIELDKKKLEKAMEKEAMQYFERRFEAELRRLGIKYTKER